MIYPENSYQKLGFDEIKEKVVKYCLSPMGRQLAQELVFLTDFSTIDTLLSQVEEYKLVLQNNVRLVRSEVFDNENIIAKVRLEGAYLTELEANYIYQSLKDVQHIFKYFDSDEVLSPSLRLCLENIKPNYELNVEFDRIFDDNGHVRENASPELLDICLSITKYENESRKKVEHVFKHAQNNGWTAEGNMTIKAGRLCIPILSENKRKIKGYIHDESASGQTAYIEPEDVFNLNNQIRDLEFQKRREIVRILTALTSIIRPYVEDFLVHRWLLSTMDFIQAKALYALEIDAHKPRFSNKSIISLLNARHPILLAQKKSVVPLNISIDDDKRILVVSGPNAGGKSVCMKTVGLLQLMVQSGLLVSVDVNSEMGVFNSIFSDIGDDQSIDGDLSTYSAHLTKMKFFSSKANAQTLVLIDELGSGTDPQFGGALAEAVLDSLNKSTARGIVTTHYSNLKIYASNHEGIENASMLFDSQNMRPLYVLSVGQPGSSFAFELAKKTGLNEDMIDYARKKVGITQDNVEKLLVSLEKEKADIRKEKLELQKKQDELQKALLENAKLKAFVEENKAAIIRNAKNTAIEIIKGANKLVENTISDIKKSKADADLVKDAREKLKQELGKNQIKENIDTQQLKDIKIDEGDWVRLQDSNVVGQVISIQKNNVIVGFDNMKTTTKLSRIQKISHAEARKNLKGGVSSSLRNSSLNHVSELNVIGLRTEEALKRVDKYMDEAIMLGMSKLKIVHGKGDGILRKMIREYLAKYSQVSSFENEHLDYGGDGITYVIMK